MNLGFAGRLVTIKSNQDTTDIANTPATVPKAGEKPKVQFPAPEQKPSRRAWLDVLWPVLLGSLAIVPPVGEIHKQLTLVGIGLFQIFERSVLRRLPPSRARAYVVLVKILLATLLVGHTEEVPINSSYYLIYYLPVVSAATLYGLWGTVLWTSLVSAAYCSYLLPALQDYELTPAGLSELVMRNLFLFMAAIAVNQFVSENRRQTRRYRELAETLADTNRRLAQAQEEARRSERLAALGQLSAGLAHEIRNPLGVIKGSAEMLNRKLRSSDPVTVELVSYIYSEVNRLNGLVSRFLDFARPLKPELRLQEVVPILEQALHAVQIRWPESKVESERHYPAESLLALLDAGLCEQVFTNLVLNAHEAMPEGGTLKLTITPAESEGRQRVTIDIEDSGPGIPPEICEQIFNPFFTTKSNDVGLRLSIVSKIVDDHRGWLRVLNTTGKGAGFRVFLPSAHPLPKEGSQVDSS